MIPLEEVVRRFKIGEPLRTLFNPRFEVNQRDAARFPFMDDFYHVRLTAEAPDAYEKLRKVYLTLDEYFDRGREDWYYTERLRNMLKNMVTHEVDEAIQYDGQRIFDPHRTEKGPRL